MILVNTSRTHERIGGVCDTNDQINDASRPDGIPAKLAVQCCPRPYTDFARILCSPQGFHPHERTHVRSFLHFASWPLHGSLLIYFGRSFPMLELLSKVVCEPIVPLAAI